MLILEWEFRRPGQPWEVVKDGEEHLQHEGWMDRVHGKRGLEKVDDLRGSALRSFSVPIANWGRAYKWGSCWGLGPALLAINWSARVAIFDSNYQTSMKPTLLWGVQQDVVDVAL